jgi:sulfotransferase
MFHFISGLPRAGSTLLASILNQNPACSASIQSPLGRVITEALAAMGPSNEAHGFISNEQRARILRGVFDGYYAEDVCLRKSVIFDNNRRWCANAALIAELYPESKIICCLRSPAAIVDSFEQMFQQNPLNLSVAYGATANLTVYERVKEIMKPTGVVGFALNAFRTACFGPHRDRLVLVSYDDLCRFPAQIMEELSKTLHLPQNNYDFGKIEQIPGAEKFDRDISTPGLHTLRTSVSYEERQTILPPDIFASLPPAFWEVKEEVTSPK